MKNKITVYLDDQFNEELKEAAELQQRSVSWLVEHAWRLSRGRILGYPAVAPGTADDMYAS